MKMTIPYNITGKHRKQLAEDISVALHTIPKYLGYPTCNYQIGDCTLERDGKLIIPDCVADETARVLLEHLRSRGYVGEAIPTESWCRRAMTYTVSKYAKQPHTHLPMV